MTAASSAQSAEDTTDLARLARAAHRTLEPLHASTYFAPDAQQIYAEAGVSDAIGAYFASRSAALGVVPAEVVIATFYNFSPTLVRRAIPSVWETATPAGMLRARLQVVDSLYRQVLGEQVLESAEMTEAAELAAEAMSVLRPEGRPLYAAHAALPWPEPAHLRLFCAATLLREHRGDGHIAALVLAGLSGLEAVVSYARSGLGMPEEFLRRSRGYSRDEWADGVRQLTEKGLLDADGAPSDAGRALRDQLEAQTDAAAAAPYAHLGPDRTQRLRELVRPWARALSESLPR